MNFIMLRLVTIFAVILQWRCTASSFKVNAFILHFLRTVGVAAANGIMTMAVSLVRKKICSDAVTPSKRSKR